MKRLLSTILICLVLISASVAWATTAFLKESDGVGDKILKESDGVGGAILKEYSAAPLILIDGNNGTYSYILFDGGSTYDPVVQVTGTGNTFENCTFYSANGLAIDIDESCIITNCIIEGNTQDIDIAAAKTVTAKNNLLPNHANATDNIGAGTYTDTDSVYALDPLFRVAGSDFRLTAASPCRDTGYNTGADTDILGVITPQYGVHDIGAYEYPRRSSGSTTMGMGLKGYCPHHRYD